MERKNSKRLTALTDAELGDVGGGILPAALIPAAPYIYAGAGALALWGAQKIGQWYREDRASIASMARGGGPMEERRCMEQADLPPGPRVPVRR